MQWWIRFSADLFRMAKWLDRWCLNLEDCWFDTCVVQQTFPSQPSWQEWVPNSLDG